MRKFPLVVAAIITAAVSVAQLHSKNMRFRFQGADGGAMVQLAQMPDVQRELKVTKSQSAKLADIEKRMESAIADKLTLKTTLAGIRNLIMETGNNSAAELPK